MQIVSKIQHVIHKYLIFMLILSYFIAAFFPGAGLLIRNVDLGAVELGRTSIAFTAPSLMLAILLFNASLGTRANDLRNLVHHPRLLAVGVAGNVLAPLILIAAVSFTMLRWRNHEELEQMLTGLAFIAAMPIAGASTAWAQNANGNLALSLGLILATTLLSPVLTPFVLNTVGFITTGDYSTELHGFAGNGAGAFLGAWVILPSLLGLSVQFLLGEKRAARASPYLRLVNSVVLIVLNYSNASLSLPGVVSHPDLDFVAIVLIVVGLLCLAMFGVGYLIARVDSADRGATASLMFGLGMNNNGAGLVLASLAISNHPGVTLPIILYNLIQHLVASFVDKVLFRAAWR